MYNFQKADEPDEFEYRIRLLLDLSSVILAACILSASTTLAKHINTLKGFVMTVRTNHAIKTSNCRHCGIDQPWFSYSRSPQDVYR